MAYRVLILSPLHNMGTTVGAALLGQGLTYSGHSSTLVFTDPKSYLPQYLGLEGISDPTRSITQVVELIENDALKNREILNYGHLYAKNAYLLNTANPALNDVVRAKTVHHIYERVTSDVVICDCSDDIETPIVSELLDITDMVMVVVTPSPKAIQYVMNWLEYSVLKDSSNVFILLNEYHETIAAIRDFAKSIKFSAGRVCKLHYNPWIGRCSFNGSLPQILPLAMGLDPRVSNLISDVYEFNQAVETGMILNSKRGY